MDLHIDDLKLSYHAKNTLHELGFTMVSDLKGHDYISLIQKFPLKRHRVYSIIKELNDAGYLLPSDNEITIYDVPMSKRLLHIFERNYILYLSQLSTISKEEISRFRNLGEQTMLELEKLCLIYHIELNSVQNIKDNLAQYHLPFTSRHYDRLFTYNITYLNDFNNITTHDMHIICEQYYPDTMKTYYILKNNGIVFQSWEDMYMFEVLPQEMVQKLNRVHRIYTVRQLCSCSEKYIDSMPSSILPDIKAVLDKYQNSISII